jgi:hypothetical protein
MAISILKEEMADKCDGNIFSEYYDKYHCKKCYNWIHTFCSLPKLKDFFNSQICGS